MRWFKILAVLALVALAIAFAPKVSRADEPDYSNPAVLGALVERLAKAGPHAERLFMSFSPKAQQAVVDGLKGSKIVRTFDVSDDMGAESVDACKWIQQGYEMYSAVGIKLWGYYQKIDWCYNGTVVTSVTRNRWVSVYAPFWSFTKHVGNLVQGGVSQSYYRAFTQGEFKFCVGGNLGCAQYIYPWIDMTVRGNGRYSSAAGQ